MYHDRKLLSGSVKKLHYPQSLTLSARSQMRMVPSSLAEMKTSLEGCVARPQMRPCVCPFIMVLEAAFFSPTSMISPSFVPTKIFPCHPINKHLTVFLLDMHLKSVLMKHDWRTFPRHTDLTVSTGSPVSSWNALHLFISWSHSFTAPPSLVLRIHHIHINEP